jgi:hypothetical protein
LAAPQSTIHAYEVRPRKDHRGIDLISDALPFESPLPRFSGSRQNRF